MQQKKTIKKKIQTELKTCLLGIWKNELKLKIKTKIEQKMEVMKRELTDLRNDGGKNILSKKKSILQDRTDLNGNLVRIIG